MHRYLFLFRGKKIKNASFAKLMCNLLSSPIVFKFFFKLPSIYTKRWFTTYGKDNEWRYIT